MNNTDTIRVRGQYCRPLTIKMNHSLKLRIQDSGNTPNNFIVC